MVKKITFEKKLEKKYHPWVVTFHIDNTCQLVLMWFLRQVVSIWNVNFYVASKEVGFKGYIVCLPN